MISTCFQKATIVPGHKITSLTPVGSDLCKHEVLHKPHLFLPSSHSGPYTICIPRKQSDWRYTVHSHTWITKKHMRKIWECCSSSTAPPLTPSLWLESGQICGRLDYSLSDNQNLQRSLVYYYTMEKIDIGPTLTRWHWDSVEQLTSK